MIFEATKWLQSFSTFYSRRRLSTTQFKPCPLCTLYTLCTLCTLYTLCTLCTLRTLCTLCSFPFFGTGIPKPPWSRSRSLFTKIVHLKDPTVHWCWTVLCLQFGRYLRPFGPDTTFISIYFSITNSCTRSFISQPVGAFILIMGTASSQREERSIHVRQ